MGKWGVAGYLGPCRVLPAPHHFPAAPFPNSRSCLFQALQLVSLYRCPEEAEAFLEDLSSSVPAL